MTTQRLPERALLYWRIRLLIGCLVPALLGGFLYYTAAKLFTILTLIWMAVLCCCACVLSDVSSLL